LECFLQESCLEINNLYFDPEQQRQPKEQMKINTDSLFSFLIQAYQKSSYSSTNSKTQETRENPNNPQEIRSSLESNLIPKLGYSYNKTLSNKIQIHHNISRSEVFSSSSKTKSSNTHTLNLCDFPNSQPYNHTYPSISSWQNKEWKNTNKSIKLQQFNRALLLPSLITGP